MCGVDQLFFFYKKNKTVIDEGIIILKYLAAGNLFFILLGFPSYSFKCKTKFTYYYI